MAAYYGQRVTDIPLVETRKLIFTCEFFFNGAHTVKAFAMRGNYGDPIATPSICHEVFH